MSDNPIFAVLQSQESAPDAAGPSPAPLPRCRFHSRPPATITLKAADFAPAIPPAARRESFNPAGEVNFSCAEIFRSPVPKISLGRLASLMPGAIAAEGMEETPILLPVEKLARNFRFLLQKELLGRPDPVIPAAIVETPAVSDQPPAPAAGTRSEKKGKSWTSSFFSGTARVAQKLFVEDRPPEPAAPGVQEISPAPPPPALLPPAEEPDFPEPPAAVAFSAPEEERAGRVMAIEHLPAEGTPEIPDQDRLQQLLMTEDDLTVKRVVELCGNLPGISSCILAHGPGIIASYNVPASVDFVALSGHALEMLEGMRYSTNKMGLGSIPAVTIHSEKGPVSFVSHGALCLLVLHKDRAFVPGVREKLQNVLGELSQARLPRAVPPAQALAEK